MLAFAYPWFAVIVILPIAVVFLVPARMERRAALRAPFFDRIVRLTGARPGDGATRSARNLCNLGVLIVCWLLAVAALMRPQWIEPPLHRDVPTRDLLLLVDLSGSMDTRDFVNAAGETVDRLTAVKQTLDEFLARRQGDRVGIVVFGDAPFVLVPFTTDLQLCRKLIGEMAVGMAGPRTAFGDAIGLGIGLFDKSAVRAKTMIALTDGNDTASQVPPIEAARVAKDKGIVIHTVGVGDPRAAGEDKLDEDALTRVAQTTGGGFFRALDRAQLAQVYSRLNEIETHRIDNVAFRPKTDLFWIPTGAALLLSMLARAVALIWRAIAGRRRGAIAFEAAAP